MKALFIAYNQSYNEEICDILAQFGQRGYTKWEDIEGKGSFNGQARFGSHAWPEMNHAVLSVVKDDKVEPILQALKAKDESSRNLDCGHSFGILKLCINFVSVAMVAADV